MVRNTTSVLPPKTVHEGYHLSEDLADDAIGWLHKHKAFQPDKPFFMYWASGAIHGPHHIMKEWADKYRGKFDDGWDAYRERVFRRAKEKGWIPVNAQLTSRHETMPSWDSAKPAATSIRRRWNYTGATTVPRRRARAAPEQAAPPLAGAGFPRSNFVEIQ